MKTIGTVGLVLVATAALAPAARAADLAVAAEPVDYVRVCDAYGAGFLWIPGTETCLQIKGRARADYNLYFAPSDAPGLFDDQGFDDADDRGYRFRARGNLYLDSRTATEFGLLRTYVEFELTYDSVERGQNPVLAYSLENAYIEFGGLTFGRVQSFYDYLEAEFVPAQTFDPALSDQTQNLVAYTYDFGAIEATLSLEDTTLRRYGIAEGDYGGAQAPDVVGRLLWEDDAIGSAQLMAAGHYINALGLAETGGGRAVRRTDEAYGFAVGGGFALKVPIGNDTSVGATATYARGALSYLSVDIGSPYGVFDAAFGPGRPIGRRLALSEGVSVSGGFSTAITDTVGFAAQAGWLYVDAPDADVDFDEDGRRDDLDLQNIDAQAYVKYEPVADFTLGLGAEYRLVDAEDFGDGSIVTTFFRAERIF